MPAKQFTHQYISQDQEGGAMSKKKCGCGQDGDGLADLAIKALSHLIPALLAKFGEKAGDVLSNEAIQFARVKGLIKDPSAISGAGYKLKPKPKPKADKKFRGEEVQHGVLVKSSVASDEFPSTGLSPYSVSPGIIPVPKKQTKKGGGSNLAGGSSNLPGGSNYLPSDSGSGVFLAGVDSYVPKKRGRPVGSGKKKPSM
jgi:hypothetical protein